MGAADQGRRHQARRLAFFSYLDSTLRVMPALAANLAQAAFESGSMVKAAVRLGLSQPTVSEVIAELEHPERYWRGAP